METWSYGEAAEPTTFPWPPAEEGSLLGSFGETWRSATFDPGSFFRRLPPDGSTGAAVIYYLVVGILVAGAGLFWDMTGVFTRAAGDDALAAEMGFGSVDPIIGFLISPLVLLVALFMAAGITHLLLLVFGGAHNGFGTTVRVFCYAYSPMAFGVVPILGAIVGTVWMVVLSIIGLREAHRTDGWKAALAVLLPFILMVGMVILAMVFLAAAAATLLGG